ncbi:MAG: hypothetical protein Q4E33_05530 [Erysipelotrichaceae bacterium]|nr:hypothetical protein [Erysipelotrichaceae bacterium]
MKINEFYKNYEFHDSLINNIKFNQEKGTLSINIELCNYEQKYYKEGDDEIIIIDVIFKGCKSYDSLVGELDAYSILDTVLNNDNQITFNVLDDFNDNYYELHIQADSVEVLKVK